MKNALNTEMQEANRLRDIAKTAADGAKTADANAQVIHNERMKERQYFQSLMDQQRDSFLKEIERISALKSAENNAILQEM